MRCCKHDLSPQMRPFGHLIITVMYGMLNLLACCHRTTLVSLLSPSLLFRRHHLTSTTLDFCTEMGGASRILVIKIGKAEGRYGWAGFPPTTHSVNCNPRRRLVLQARPNQPWRKLADCLQYHVRDTEGDPRWRWFLWKAIHTGVGWVWLARLLTDVPPRKLRLWVHQWIVVYTCIGCRIISESVPV